MLLFLISLAVAVYSVFIFRLVLIIKSQGQKEIRHSVIHGSETVVSVVTACKNEEKDITRLLRSLSEQDYPEKFLEIIIVDDNSTDGTSEKVLEFTDKYRGINRHSIKYIRNNSEGKKSAISNGVRASSGELILVTDADCIMQAGWVSAVELLYRQMKPDIITGRVVCRGDGSFASAFDSYESASLQGVTESMVLARKPVMCNGANMAFRKEAYLKHAGELRNDIPSGDDMFLLHAIKKAGGRILWNHEPGSEVVTQAKSDFKSILRQRARWASKAVYYTDYETILTAVVILAANVSMPVLFTGAFFSSGFPVALPAAFLLKASAEGLLIKQVKKKQKEVFSLPLFIIMDIIYPFYFITVFAMSFFPRMKKFTRR